MVGFPKMSPFLFYSIIAVTPFTFIVQMTIIVSDDTTPCGQVLVYTSCKGMYMYVPIGFQYSKCMHFAYKKSFYRHVQPAFI